MVVIGLSMSWKITVSRLPVFHGDFPLKVKWTYQAPRIIEAIAVSPSGVILIHTSRQLIALDSTSGEKIWEFPIRDSVYFTTPLIVNGIVYDLDNELVFALDEANGNLLWTKHLKADTRILEASASYLFINRPSKDILALDRFSGEILWQIPASRGHTMIFVNDPIIFAVDEGIDEYRQIDGRLSWERMETGILDADFNNQNLYYIRSTSVAAGQNEELYEIVALDIETHAFLWRRYLSGSRDPYLRATSNYVLLSLNPFLYAISPDTGDILWQTEVKIGLKPTILGDTAYVLEGFARQLFATQLHTGKELGYLELSAPVFTFTVRDILKASDDFLVVAARDRLFLLTPK
jgi:outer membrane protein assembly factor BamB